MNILKKIKRKIRGSKRQADYMRRFHKREDGNETILSRVAQTLWYGKIASNYTLPIGFVGYSEEYDNLIIDIDDVHYQMVLEPVSIDK